MLFHHVCIQTDCYGASLEFYCKALGMTVQKETANFHGRAYNTWLEGHGVFIELQTPKGGETFSPVSKHQSGPAHICFYTEDLEGQYRTLHKLGAAFREKDGGAIYTVEDGRLMKAVAPEGTIIEFRDRPGC